MTIGLLTPRSIVGQAAAMVLFCVLVTLVLSFGAVALAPPPPPETVSVASYISAYEVGSNAKVSSTPLPNGPNFAHSPADQPEALIAASLSDALSLPPSRIRVVMVRPTILGFKPEPHTGPSSHMTVIDVPKPMRVPPVASERPPSLSTILQATDTRLPPFWAAIEHPQRSWLLFQPHEPLPSAWHKRLLAVLIATMLLAVPLATYAARRWTISIRVLAERMRAFDGINPEHLVSRQSGAREVQALNRAFDGLQDKVRSHNDERTAMLAAVAHDLRTPLTSLRIRAEDAPPEIRSGIARDLERVQNMIDEVLRFAASGRPPPNAPVDLVKIVAASSDTASERGINIQLITPETAPVLGSELDISRVLDNLIDNASSFGKTITVRIIMSGKSVISTVSDDGPGVPAHLLVRLTEPFFRVENSRSSKTGGIGLGLATANSIVIAHRGTLTFRNAPDGGLIACLTLPLAPPTSA